MAGANNSLEIQFNNLKSQLSRSIEKQYDEKLLKIFSIERQNFPLLRTCLYGNREQTGNLRQESWRLFYRVSRLVPSKKLQFLLAAQPISDITVVEYREKVQYVYLTTDEDGDMLVVGDQWVAVPGSVKNQLKHYPFLLPDPYVYPDITEEEEEENIRNGAR